MKQVRVHKKRGISPKASLLLIFGMLLVALCLYLLSRPAALPAPQAIEDTSVILYEHTEDELLSFTIEPTRGLPYTIRKSYSGYSIDNYPDYDINLELLRDMVDSIVYLQASENLGHFHEEDIVDLSMFGLDEGAFELTARFSDESEYTLRIGSRIPGDIPSDYAMLEGSSTIYSLSISIKEDLDVPVNWLHTLPSVNFTPDLLERIQFTSPQENLVLTRAAENVWVMESPHSYPVSRSKMDALKSNIGKMRFASFVESTDTADLSHYGLDQPRLSVIFELAPSTITSYSSDMQTSQQIAVDAQAIVMEVGSLIDGIGFYCLYNGAVYQASDLSMGFMLDASAEDYLSDYPVGLPLSTLDAFSITQENGTTTLYRVELVEDIQSNNAVTTDSYGDTLYNFAFTDDAGHDVPSEQPMFLYSSLNALRSTGIASPTKLDDAQPAILEVQIMHPHFTRTIKFYPYDALHAAIEVDGSIVHYTDLAYLNEIQRILADISGK